jgi:hypothetical protein
MQNEDIDKVLKKLDIAFTIDLVESVVFASGGTDNHDNFSKALQDNGYKLECHHDGTMVVRK